MKYAEPFLLSESGSTRATAYGFSSKSITRDGKTHVVWLDAVARVSARTYDHDTRSWSETFLVGEGQDNHASPALVVDRAGYLHIAYGPHSRGWNDGRFKYALSQQPNRADHWQQPEETIANFGCRATYACLIHTPAEVDAIVYRGGDYPLSLMFQRRHPLGGWTPAQAIFRQDIVPQYTHYGGTCACGANGTLYVAGHFYNVGAREPGGAGERAEQRSHGMAIVKTPDLGETWTDLAGEAVRVPTPYDGRIAIPPVGENLRVAGLAVDSVGRPWTLALHPDVGHPRLLLSHWADGGWRTTDLAAHLPPGREASDAAMTIDSQDRVHLAVSAVDVEAASSDAPEVHAWGHPSNDVFHLMFEPTSGTATCTQVSRGGPAANWLPSISRSGVFHPVHRPTILYTSGVPGRTCSSPERTKVYCVLVDPTE